MGRELVYAYSMTLEFYALDSSISLKKIIYEFVDIFFILRITWYFMGILATRIAQLNSIFLNIVLN